MSGVGELISKRRLSLGMTQEELAERVDKDQSYVSQIERGKVHRPGDALIRRFATALDIPEVELMRATGRLVEIITGGGDSAWVPLRGRVPADSVRWTELEQKGQSEEITQSEIDAMYTAAMERVLATA